MLKVKNNADSAEMYIYGDIIDDLDMDPMAGFEWPSDINRQLDECSDGSSR